MNNVDQRTAATEETLGSMCVGSESGESFIIHAVLICAQTDDRNAALLCSLTRVTPNRCGYGFDFDLWKWRRTMRLIMYG